MQPQPRLLLFSTSQYQLVSLAPLAYLGQLLLLFGYVSFSLGHLPVNGQDPQPLVFGLSAGIMEMLLLVFALMAAFAWMLMTLEFLLFARERLVSSCFYSAAFLLGWLGFYLFGHYDHGLLYWLFD